MTFPDSFLWGASTSALQTEGNDVNSDWWHRETATPSMQRSGDAVDSYHRYAEDMALLADAGLNAYRFGIEWARIEPRPGEFSRAKLAHYRRMIETALDLGLTPVVTLQHFTTPQWFIAEGGWLGHRGLERFGAYVSAVTEILEGVDWVVTINEPNIAALFAGLAERRDDEWQSPTVDDGSSPSATTPPTLNLDLGQRLVAAHKVARDILRARTRARIGWTVANQAFTPTPGNEAVLEQVRYAWEDLYLDASRGDDFIGVQSYTSQPVDDKGPVPHPESPDNTLTGWAYRPDALGIAVRHAWERTGGVPILVTENGIATADDARRIDYTAEALWHLGNAIADGVDVRGYLHWSLLDNYEWGHWEPTFGLIAVDRETFRRTPKPSLQWLGDIATGAASIDIA